MIVTDNVPIPFLMTRPRRQAEAFVADLPPDMRSKLEIIYTPVIEIEGLDPSIDLKPDEEVIFTSANGVLLTPAGDGRAAYCVGEATSQCAKERGWQALCLGETSAELVERLLRTPPDSPLVHLAGIHTRGRIAEKLGDAGLALRYVPVYDQVLKSLSREATDAINRGKPFIVPLFSPRSAKQFAEKAGNVAHGHVIALSATVATELGDTHFASCDIARAPNADAMRYSIAERLGALQMG